ncbi:hypothetical protein BDZ97DRAFT_2055860 [Flammula alnicola]|nr:hypothetical protein BDZ97DRAFT_2055860 [Flammula alnicola]
MRRPTSHLPRISFTLLNFRMTTKTKSPTSTTPISIASGGSRDEQLIVMTRHQSVTCHSTDNIEQETQNPPTQNLSQCLSTGQDVSRGSSDDDTDDRKQESSKNACEAMSASALIAHSYRVSTNSDKQKMSVSAENLISSQQAPELSHIDYASCLPPSLAMCGPAAEADAFQEHSKLSTHTKNSHQLHSMLCDAPPVIIDNVQKEYNDHEVLNDYRRVPNNIVIDSVCPELAPHIVITPAPEQWDLRHIVESNRAGCQFRPQLTVPPFFGLTCRMHTYEEMMALFCPPPPQEIAYEPPSDQQDAQNDQSKCQYEQPQCQHEQMECQYEHSKCRDEQSDCQCPQTEGQQEQTEGQQECNECQGEQPITTPAAPLVFNPRWFRFPVHIAEPERVTTFICDLVSILNRQLFKATAVAASLKADAFRIRYDTPEFLESVEQPYQWSDPADPIFSDMGNYCPQYLTVIRSVDPFSVPHIFIHSAPSNDPLTALSNISGPQDCAFGDLLVVPSTRQNVLEYVNFEADDEDEDMYTAQEQDYDALTDASSDSEFLRPQTPSDLQRVRSGFFSGFPEEEEEEDITSAYLGYKDYAVVAEEEEDLFFSTDEEEDLTCFIQFQDHRPSTPKFYIPSNDDWDTDSLPDLETDEFYKPLLARSVAVDDASVSTGLRC